MSGRKNAGFDSNLRETTIALMLATAMQAFDATIVNVALPQLQRGLGGGLELGSWVVTSYLCAAAVSAPLTGWLRRRYGARSSIAGAIALFVLGSVLCASATSLATLVLFRLVQGAAAGAIQPLAQAILLDVHPKERHGRMLASLGAAIMAGPVLGPILGGVITDLTSWRWIFLINVPLGLLAVFGLRWISPLRQPARETPLDVVGALLLVIGVGTLQLALERSIGRDWLHSPELIADAAIIVLTFVIMAVRAMRIEFTILQFAVFRDFNFAMASFYNFMVAFFLFTTIVFVPALGEGPLGFSATVAGGIIAPRAIATMVMMLIVRRVIDRLDQRILLAVGLAVSAAALGFMSAVTREDAILELTMAGVIQGLGVGLLFTPLSTLAYSTLPAPLRTDAAGVYILLRQLGSAAGVATMTAVLQDRIAINLARLSHHPAITAIPLAGLTNRATFEAYADSFRIMAEVSILILPGIVLFRTWRHGAGLQRPA